MIDNNNKHCLTIYSRYPSGIEELRDFILTHFQHALDKTNSCPEVDDDLRNVGCYYSQTIFFKKGTTKPDAFRLAAEMDELIRSEEIPFSGRCMDWDRQKSWAGRFAQRFFAI